MPRPQIFFKKWLGKPSGNTLAIRPYIQYSPVACEAEFPAAILSFSNDPGVNSQAEVAVQELNNVENKSFISRDFRLKNGHALPMLTIAYETYGELAPDGRNAVLITHG